MSTPRKAKVDLEHITAKHYLSFLGISKQAFMRYEGVLFQDFSKAYNGFRHIDIYSLAHVYSLVWNKKPTLYYVTAWLEKSGFTENDVTEAQVVLAKLESRGLVVR